MFSYTIAELAQVTSGTIGGGDPNSTVSGFFVDSRQSVVGGVFVAIVGERVDGHLFLSDVRSAGAGLALINDSFKGVVPQDLPVLIVADSVKALGQIAHWTRVTKMSATVIGVTGSSGKTTTKDFIAKVLEQCGPTEYARNSFNTEVGLPLTIVGANSDTQFLVLEMGMRGIGHIETLAQIAAPDIGVVTNVGSAHVGLLGSVDNIARAKGELIRALGPHGCAVLNADDPLVRNMSTTTSATIVMYGEHPDAHYRATDIALGTDGRASYTLHHQGESYPVDLLIPGEHQVPNSLAAIAACASAGIEVGRVALLISQVDQISKWRMEVTHLANDVTVINDCYNANPESMRAALKTLANMARGKRSIAVLGPMKELGDHSMQEHDSLGRLAVRLDISRLLCVGDEMKVTHLGASQEGSWGDESHWVPDVEAALEYLRTNIESGDVVLIKASRSVGLDRVAHALISGEISKVSGGQPEGVS